MQERQEDRMAYIEQSLRSIATVLKEKEILGQDFYYLTEERLEEAERAIDSFLISHLDSHQ